MAGLNVSIGADSSKAERELRSFERKTKGIAKSIAKGFKERIGHKMFDGLAGAARRIPGLLNDAVQSASDLNEEISKSETVFGSSSKEIQKWAKGAADAMGLSEVAALEASGTVGNMFRAMGMAENSSARMSKAMVGLAADLGSFNNTSTEDAINAIGAALRGESEPIRRYGVLLDDATLKAEALAMGLYDGVGALDPATRALAAYEVIMKQTTTAQGDFQKTSDGLANSQKILKAKMADASGEIGKALLPAMNQLVSIMRETDWKGIAEDVGTVASAFAKVTSGVMNAYEGVKMFLNDRDGIADASEYAETTPAFEVSGTQGADFYLKHGTEEKKKEIRSLLAQEDEDKQWQSMLSAYESTPAKMQKVKTPIASSKLTTALKKTDPVSVISEDTTEEDRIKRKRDDLNRNADMAEDSLGSALSRSSNLAVSSMQSIGGGGGAYGELDLQRKQADLQGKMVGLLQDIKNMTPKDSISDF